MLEQFNEIIQRHAVSMTGELEKIIKSLIDSGIDKNEIDLKQQGETTEIWVGKEMLVRFKIESRVIQEGEKWFYQTSLVPIWVNKTNSYGVTLN